LNTDLERRPSIYQHNNHHYQQQQQQMMQLQHQQHGAHQNISSVVEWNVV